LILMFLLRPSVTFTRLILFTRSGFITTPMSRDLERGLQLQILQHQKWVKSNWSSFFVWSKVMKCTFTTRIIRNHLWVHQR
jgi:hypothetical protein